MSVAAVLTPDGDGVLVRIRLTPKADRDALDGIRKLSDGTEVVAARVRAVPDKGKANAALEGLLAKVFGLPKSGVALKAGHTARIKTVRFDAAPDKVAQILSDLPEL